jgi:ABC-2 type transport system ATP-binding protein
MKRPLNMAAGLIHRPRIVLMDEPTVGVDPQSRLRIFEMIEALRREGMSVIYTSHYMEEAERLCDRIAIIDHGRIIALGSKDELIRSAFGSRSQVVVRLADTGDRVLAWMERHGGRCLDGTAQFTIDQPREIAVHCSKRRLTKATRYSTCRFTDQTWNLCSCN